MRGIILGMGFGGCSWIDLPWGVFVGLVWIWSGDVYEWDRMGVMIMFLLAYDDAYTNEMVLVPVALHCYVD